MGNKSTDMRWHRVGFLAGLLWVSLSSRMTAAEEDAEEEAEEIDAEAEQEAEEEAPAVEDFDLGMSEDTQKARMQLCMYRMVERMQEQKDHVANTAKEIASQQPGVDEQQVMNNIMFTWMMQCYISIEKVGLLEVPPSTPLTASEQAQLFDSRAGPQDVQKTSKRQWTLLQTVLTESQKQQDNAQQQQRGAPRRGFEPPVPSSSSSAYWALLAFAFLFGLVAFAVMVLIRSQNSKQEKLMSKRAEKEAKKLRKNK